MKNMHEVPAAAAVSIQEALRELREFSNEHTSIDDPMHPMRVKAKELLASPKFRDLTNTLTVLGKELGEINAGIERVNPAVFEPVEPEHPQPVEPIVPLASAPVVHAATLPTDVK